VETLVLKASCGRTRAGGSFFAFLSRSDEFSTPYLINTSLIFRKCREIRRFAIKGRRLLNTKSRLGSGIGGPLRRDAGRFSTRRKRLSHKPDGYSGSALWQYRQP
jgi:hypothetical protein